MRLSYASPAKVNLLLRILSKREDGYHNLFSLVDVISLYDILHFEEQPSDVVVVKDDRDLLPEGDRNTVFRAVMLLKQRYGVRRGVRISIEKNIPIGSGLGGPSSDAATAFKALNVMWGLQIDEETLMKLGAEIGADVPLFLHGRSCLMEGIGERITPVALPRLWYLVIYPNMILSTAEVYSRLKIVLTKGENDIKLTGNLASVCDVSRILENDLENVGTLMCPKIQDVKERLMGAGSIGALMSGSGSSVFGIFESEGKARDALPFLEGMGSLFITHSI